MRILVTNDDGIQSLGMQQLVRYLSKDNEVYVVAPDSQRSGFSHSMTFRRPMQLKEYPIEGAKKSYSLTGAPADCVRFAVRCLKLPIDMVVAGPNVGPNLTVDVYYSGTVGAASEGVIMGLPSVALSYACEHIDQNLLDFDAACSYLTDNVGKLFELSKKGTFFNINVPCVPKDEIKGVKVVKYGEKMFEDLYELYGGEEARENEYWLTGDFVAFNEVEETDAYYIGQGYITITPLKIDICDWELLKELEGKF
ncbi:MAG: 5'/3'-nucleotidase SurE [Clostridiales bacterium]|nr:5'/3'-nucleotidase SurE [Clostridiales bacterium]